MFKFLFVAMLVLASAADAACKVWQYKEVIKAEDLNACHNYINSTVVGQRGARLVDADVSPTANIALSKIASGTIFPKAWASLLASCNGAAAAGTACVVAGSTGIASVKSTGSTGTYGVTLNYTPSSTAFAVLVTPGVAGRYCSAGTQSTTGTNFVVACNDSTGAAVNTAFSVLVMGP